MLFRSNMQLTNIQEVLSGGKPPGRTSSREDVLPKEKYHQDQPKPTKNWTPGYPRCRKTTSCIFQVMPWPRPLPWPGPPGCMAGHDHRLAWERRPRDDTQGRSKIIPKRFLATKRPPGGPFSTIIRQKKSPERDASDGRVVPGPSSSEKPSEMSKHIFSNDILSNQGFSQSETLGLN